MSDNLQQRDLNVLWHPCSQMGEYAVFPPVEIVAAEGPYLIGADQKKYIDGVSSWWCRHLVIGIPKFSTPCDSNGLF